MRLGRDEKNCSRHTPYALRACEVVTPTRFARKYHSGASRPVNPILRQKTAAVLQSSEVLNVGRIIRSTKYCDYCFDNLQQINYPIRTVNVPKLLLQNISLTLKPVPSVKKTHNNNKMK